MNDWRGRQVADMMSDVGALDHVIYIVKIGIVGMKASEVVEHQAFQLVFSTRGVKVDQ